MPGVNSIEHLELQNGVDTSQDASAEKTKQVLTYARKAQTEISTMAEKVRRATIQMPRNFKATSTDKHCRDGVN